MTTSPKDTDPKTEARSKLQSNAAPNVSNPATSSVKPLPVGQAEIDVVFGDSSPEQEGSLPAPTLRSEWAQFFAFLRRPTLEQIPIATSRGLVLWRIYLLDILAIAAFVALASAIVTLGVELPETAISGMEMGLGLAFAAIVMAPIMEELGFRSWLSGRPAHVAAVLFLIAGIGFFGVLNRSGNQALGAVALIAGLIMALASVIFLWKRPSLSWFKRLFPLFFWFSATAFALIHIHNFENKSLVLLALVLPQFMLGTMAGYVRVRIGLWAAIALHMAHNATALGLAYLVSDMG